MATRAPSRKTSGQKSKSAATGTSRKPAVRRSAKAATGAPRSRPAAAGKRTGGSKTASKAPPRRVGTSARSSATAARGAAPAKSAGSRKSAPARTGRIDALKLLKQDHETVDQMFRKYERMKEGDERKAALQQRILEEVRVHAQVEEEIFYPALRTRFEAEGKDSKIDLLEEADVEHATIKWLIEQLEGGSQADEATTDARVKVMGEYIRHHVEEEEGQMFKAARKVDLDLAALGAQMDARKRQLKGEEPPGDDEGGDAGMQINEPAQMASGFGRN